MAVTGLSSAYGNVYESRYASSKKEVTEKQEAELSQWRKAHRQWFGTATIMGSS